MNCLNKYNLPIKLEKTQWLCKKLPFLGCILSHNSIEVHPEKIQAIQKINPPHTVSQIESFISTVKFCRNFVQNITELLQPMQQILNNYRSDNKCFNKAELITLTAETKKNKKKNSSK